MISTIVHDESLLCHPRVGTNKLILLRTLQARLLPYRPSSVGQIAAYGGIKNQMPARPGLTTFLQTKAVGKANPKRKVSTGWPT
jgi:hypothetical protein